MGSTKLAAFATNAQMNRYGSGPTRAFRAATKTAGVSPRATSSTAPAAAQTASGHLNGRVITPAMASPATVQVSPLVKPAVTRRPTEGRWECASLVSD